jgi:hypothetical protein
MLPPLLLLLLLLFVLLLLSACPLLLPVTAPPLSSPFKAWLSAPSSCALLLSSVGHRPKLPNSPPLVGGESGENTSRATSAPAAAASAVALAAAAAAVQMCTRRCEQQIFGGIMKEKKGETY